MSVGLRIVEVVGERKHYNLRNDRKISALSLIGHHPQAPLHQYPFHIIHKIWSLGSMVDILRLVVNFCDSNLFMFVLKWGRNTDKQNWHTQMFLPSPHPPYQLVPLWALGKRLAGDHTPMWPRGSLKSRMIAIVSVTQLLPKLLFLPHRGPFLSDPSRIIDCLPRSIMTLSLTH